MNQNNKSKQTKISLLLADVDGTLVTKEKILTDRATAAVKKMYDAGIAFTITSGRPPLGMKTIVDALQLTAPIAAFNEVLPTRLNALFWAIQLKFPLKVFSSLYFS